MSSKEGAPFRLYLLLDPAYQLSAMFLLGTLLVKAGGLLRFDCST